MKEYDKEIWVAGYHVDDLTIEIDLTKIDNQDIIKFDEGVLKIKKKSEISVSYGEKLYIFEIDLIDDNMLEEYGYYVLKGGSKYTLKKSPKKVNLTEESSIKGSHERQESSCALKTRDRNQLSLPSSSKNWGGGGMNLALTIRALSNQKTTKIRYWDIMMEEPLKNLFSNLKEFHGKKRIQKEHYDKGEKDTLIKIISQYGPEDCLEIFLNKQNINSDFYLLDDIPQELRINLVISKATDGINTIGDKVIFRSSVPKLHANESLPKEAKESLIEKIVQSYENANTIVLNTVKHYDVFYAILKAYLIKFDQHNKDQETELKLFVMFTDDNIKWFKKIQDDDRTLFEGIFKHVYGIFNEKEFIKFFEEIISPAGIKEKILFNDGSPNFDRILKQLAEIRKHYVAGDSKRMYITLGKHGSVGVDENNFLVFVKTFPTRGVSIHNTSGCGDSWAGTIVLLEHHKNKISQTDEKSMSRFMRISSGAAWVRMTNHSGNIRKNEIISLLQNDYIPYAIVGTVQQNYAPDIKLVEGGKCKRIERASSIDYSQYKKIIN